MTTEVDALVAAGALKTAAPADGSNPTAPTNINARQLEAYARRAVGAFVPQLATHPIAKGGGVSLFDFSERRASNRAATLAVGSSLIDAGLGRRGHTANERLLVSRVGDALQEPFWPGARSTSPNPISPPPLIASRPHHATAGQCSSVTAATHVITKACIGRTHE